jgi:two-component system sensor histidine kinase PilS (NtrC family)
MRTTFNEWTWLEWLVKVRVIVITFLLAIEFAIVTLTTTNVSQRLFYGVIILWYVVAFVHIVALQLWREQKFHARLQVVTDLLFATVIIYVTGGIDTSFNFLYPLIIIVSSILLSQAWAYWTAGISFVLLGATLELSYFDVIASYSVTRPDWKSLQAWILINGFAYLTLAYLAGRLSNRLRQVDVELADKTFALEDLQALHENIVNSISGGLITTDLNGQIKLVNQAGQRMLDRAESEFAGCPVQEFFLDPLPDPATVPAQREVRAVTPGGTEVLFRVTLTSLYVPERGVIGNVYTFDDLTVIRRLEREIRMRDRLAAIGRLSAGIAHEIRNPLSSIAGSVKVLSSISALTDDQRALVGIVTRESERLNEIITDFLAYAREKKVESVPVDLCKLLGETLTLIRNRPEKINIVERLGCEQAFTIGDEHKLKQVFWNLCENAVRAITIAPDTSGTLTVTLVEDGEYWRISVADTGAGMTPKQTERIFEPFQTAFEGGTGLGLAIVYQIVRAHQGFIGVTSEQGKGTEFVVRFLRAEAPKLEKVEAAPDSVLPQRAESGRVGDPLSK